MLKKIPIDTRCHFNTYKMSIRGGDVALITIKSEIRFGKCFSANKTFSLWFLKDKFCLCFFYPINLVIAYYLNENKPQLLATFKTETGKLPIVNFLVVFELESLVKWFIFFENVS